METARDVVVDYIETGVGILTEHKFPERTKGAPEYKMLPESAEGEEFRYLLESFVDDFIVLAIPRAKSHLDQVVGGTMHDIHDVFLKKRTEEEDNTIVEAKVRTGDAFTGKT